MTEGGKKSPVCILAPELVFENKLQILYICVLCNMIYFMLFY